MWDSLSAEKQAEWDGRAEDEYSDVGIEEICSNQTEFGTNIHLALSSLCKGGLLGDAELMLFYAFRDVENGDLLAGTVHGHSKHNTVHFGGEELEGTYGVPWSKFAENVIPRPVVHTSSTVTVNEDGIVNFPKSDLENMSLTDVRFILEQYLEQCWDPQSLSSIEALMLADFFNSDASPTPFRFRAQVVAPAEGAELAPASGTEWSGCADQLRCAEVTGTDSIALGPFQSHTASVHTASLTSTRCEAETRLGGVPEGTEWEKITEIYLLAEGNLLLLLRVQRTLGVPPGHADRVSRRSLSRSAENPSGKGGPSSVSLSLRRRIREWPLGLEEFGVKFNMVVLRLIPVQFSLTCCLFNEFSAAASSRRCV
ncbi:hypothetical protein C8F04DRAFT_1178330 [Mycena alexandri]|uniref:Uncharacterized protein n=1 Tax=Mycena alexandri TaxID=1745969 RepID=A0AAD6T561_9AGAR|nr:hypothetical protein C8F04DRAFT_1178330 [Mycena alexandri]